MATREDLEDLADNDRDERPNEEQSGDVLGISHVQPGGTGEIRSERGSSGGPDEGRITSVDDEADLGARDVTRSNHGETGPATGGHGSTPQRSGATGTDTGS
jgi:hypothetical protein